MWSGSCNPFAVSQGLNESQMSTNAVSPGPTVRRLIYGTTCPTVGRVDAPVKRPTFGHGQRDLFHAPDGDT